jgi:hypothetical protein
LAIKQDLRKGQMWPNSIANEWEDKAGRAQVASASLPQEIRMELFRRALLDYPKADILGASGKL